MITTKNNDGVKQGNTNFMGNMATDAVKKERVLLNLTEEQKLERHREINDKIENTLRSLENNENFPAMMSLEFDELTITIKVKNSKDSVTCESEVKLS